MSLTILTAGGQSLIQDYGRHGHQAEGITTGGPMDEHAFLWANRLLNNSFNAAQIEIALGPFRARFNQATTIAICGAAYPSRLNGQAIRLWQSHRVAAGSELTMDRSEQGIYCYLAVAGGFDCRQTLGSATTVMRESLGGLTAHGNKLAAADCVPYRTAEAPGQRQVPERFIPAYKNPVTLRFVTNHSRTGLSRLEQHPLISNDYRVTERMSRMAYCLTGKAVPTKADGILSQGVTCGTIQIPPDGQPIVLMKDHQTMGGYPIAGCVARLDLPKLAQATPGTLVRFSPVSVSLAAAELAQQLRFFGISLRRKV